MGDVSKLPIYLSKVLFGYNYGLDNLAFAVPNGKQKLDQVKVAGTMKLEQMERWAELWSLPWCRAATEIVTSRAGFLKWCVPPDKANSFSREQHVHWRWLEHLEELADRSQTPATGVLEECLPHQIRWQNRYFEIMKDDQLQLTRFIFDGRITNANCYPPPPLSWKNSCV